MEAESDEREVGRNQGIIPVTPLLDERPWAPDAAAIAER